MQYAVRKALQNDLDLLDDGFKLAINHHADKLYFCELSDVDGMPIDEQMVSEFISLYEKARDARSAAQLPAMPQSTQVQRIWIDEHKPRKHQAAPDFQWEDSAATVEMEVLSQYPRLVSKFSWDKSDGDVSSRNRLIKTKR